MSLQELVCIKQTENAPEIYRHQNKPAPLRPFGSTLVCKGYDSRVSVKLP